MDLFLQRVFDGVTNGAVYGTLALALVLVHRTSRSVNLAQGEMAILSTFIVYVLSAEVGLTIWLAIGVGVALAWCGGAAIYWVLVRPAVRKNPIALYVVPIALFIGINGLTSGIWGGDPLSLTSPFPSAINDFVGIGDTRLRYETIGVWVTLGVTLAVVFWLLERTRVGLALRGVASNPASSELVGLFPERLAAIGWGIAAAIGCLAGVMAATTSLIQPNLLLGAFVYALAAATLGGIDSPLGAVVGGLAVGLIASLLNGYVGFLAGLELLTALMVMTVVLLIKPEGLFGRKTEARV